MLKKTVETTQNEDLRTTITTTYLIWGFIIYQKSIDKAVLLTFPQAKF
jgi:hypothetical protein